MQQVKIINDPVHGFIEIPQGILLDLIDTQAFQRLRRIRQLALSSLVYPGAVHSRYLHALGAMHLTRLAMDTLRNKGIPISDEEYEAASIAILLHDIGHGPFSHALEHLIVPGLHHERLGLAIMEMLNRQFGNRLSLAIRIFQGTYERAFFHHLVSSQLDMDRMDYLIRDSFFTGVAEGIIGIDRIIKTLTVVNDQIVVEEKGIYSVEKFLIARRLMYWQVYLHKAVLAAEQMIVRILTRARILHLAGTPIFMDPHLDYLLRLPEGAAPSDEAIQHYIALDDEDILYSIKQWADGNDQALAELCKDLLNRRLFKIKWVSPEDRGKVLSLTRTHVLAHRGIPEAILDYFAFDGKVSNEAYVRKPSTPVQILRKNQTLVEITEASDLANIAALAQVVEKHYVCSIS